MNNDSLSGKSATVKSTGWTLRGEPDPRLLSRDQLAAYLAGRSTVSVPFAGACCGISRSTSYACVKDQSLQVLRLGHRLVVPTRWLEQRLCLLETVPLGQSEPAEDGNGAT